MREKREEKRTEEEEKENRREEGVYLLASLMHFFSSFDLTPPSARHVSRLRGARSRCRGELGLCAKASQAGAHTGRWPDTLRDTKVVVDGRRIDTKRTLSIPGCQLVSINDGTRYHVLASAQRS